MFAFFSSLENYFGFRTTNVKGKTDHSVSLRWNKRFWTFLKRRVFFWLCIRLICELISPGWIKTRLYSVISSYDYFFYMPRFITFAEPALSLSSVKEPYCCLITHQSAQTCALIKFSQKKKASKLTQDHFSIAQVIVVRVFFIFHYIVCFPVHCESSVLYKNNFLYANCPFRSL